MPVIREDEYRKMWDAYTDNSETLRKFEVGDKMDVWDIHRELEKDGQELKKSLDRLLDQGLIQLKTGGENLPYFQITSLGEEVTGNQDGEEYVEAMMEMEEEFDETYSG